MDKGGEMANPQLEDGHTRIANEILDNIAKMYLPPNQWQVLMVVIRRTYGFQKKVDRIANSQIAEATGLVKSTISRALRGLSERGLITRNGRSIGLQKDWEKWKVSNSANKKLAILSTKISDSEKVDDIVNKKLAILSTKVDDFANHKRKKKIKENIYIYHGEFQNVFLTDEEYQKLTDRLGEQADDYIERLSCYLKQTGRRYKSHYATILNWQRRDNESGRIKSRRLPKTYTQSPNDDI